MGKAYSGSESQKRSPCEDDICTYSKKDEKEPTMSRSGKKEFQAEGAKQVKTHRDENKLSRWKKR